MKTLRSVSLVAMAILVPFALAYGESYTVTIRPGLNLIANHLDRGNNRMRDIFPDYPSRDAILFRGSPVFIPRAGQSYDRACIVITNDQTIPSHSGTFQFFGTFQWSWDILDELADAWVANQYWPPGDGIVVDSVWDTFTYTFQGTPRLPSGRRVEIPVGGCCLLASEVMTNGTYEVVTGESPVEGVRVFRLNTNGNAYHVGPPDYQVCTFTNGAWLPEIPVLSIGEAAWFCAPAATLSIRLSDDVTSLAWPANSISYVLESATNLYPSAGWSEVSGTTTTNGALRTVTVPRSGPESRYYRLRW